MWTSTKQQCDAIGTVLRTVRLEHLWGDDGPTPEAKQYLKDKGGTLSTSEWLLLRVAFDFWGGHGKAPLIDLIGTLDDGPLQAVLDAIAVVRPGVVVRPLR